jgi:hypothetical protein
MFWFDAVAWLYHGLNLEHLMLPDLTKVAQRSALPNYMNE